MHRSRRLLLLSLWSALLSLGAPSHGAAVADEGVVLLATTTSVRDSGLLDVLLPEFQARTGLRVKPIAVGTGAALRMGEEGNADVLLTHAPSAEQVLLDSGAVVSREPFMENYFVIAGPPEDPADVRGTTSAVEAYRRIAASGAPYVSRADDSGTHKREKQLLVAAGLPEDGGLPGFIQTGTGMGRTLQVAGERRAYTLSDVGTFLAYAKRVDLVALSTYDPPLRNVYSVLRVNPDRSPAGLNTAGAAAFESFLLEPDVQRLIAEFGRERFGRSLFDPLRAAPPRAAVPE